METINETTIPQLKTLAKETDLNTEVFKALAMRERAANRSDVDAIFRELEAKLNKALDYQEYIGVWKKLETNSFGTLIHGRKGNPNRFLWKVNFTHLARKALDLPETEVPAFRQPLRHIKRKKVATKLRKKLPETQVTKEPSPHTVTFIIPATVPKEEIMALMSLGVSLVDKKQKK